VHSKEDLHAVTRPSTRASGGPRIPPTSRRKILIHINKHQPDLDEGRRNRGPPEKRGVEWRVTAIGDLPLNALPRTRPRPGAREECRGAVRAQGSAYHIHHPYNVLLKPAAGQQGRFGPGWRTALYQISIPSRMRPFSATVPPRVRDASGRSALGRDGQPADLNRRNRIVAAPGRGPWPCPADRSDFVAWSLLACDSHRRLREFVFARRAPWQGSVCSSLTELFAPEIHKQRLAIGRSTIRGSTKRALRVHSRSRVALRVRDREFGLAFTWITSDTRALQGVSFRDLAIQAGCCCVGGKMSDAIGLRTGGVAFMSADPSNDAKPNQRCVDTRHRPAVPAAMGGRRKMRTSSCIPGK